MKAARCSNYPEQCGDTGVESDVYEFLVLKLLSTDLKSQGLNLISISREFLLMVSIK